MIICAYGKPRAGKTTLAARLVQLNKRKRLKYYKRISKSKLYKWTQDNRESKPKLTKFIMMFFFRKNFYDVVYCTDETIQDTILVTYDKLGHWRPFPNALLILEEAGLGLNNLEYKSLDKLSKRLAAKHGHMGKCKMQLM